MRATRHLTTIALAAALLLPAADAVQTGEEAAAPGDVTPISSVYHVPDTETRLALVDVDGDARRDLLAVSPKGIALRRLRDDGTLPEADDSVFAWPSHTVGWNLADLDGDGSTEIVLLVDGKRVVALTADGEGRLSDGPNLVVADGFLPRGIRRVNFIRDVDGDGRLDLVLPATDHFLIHLNRPDGWTEPLPVNFRASIGLSLGDPEELDSNFGQNVHIPWFSLQDVDGDGLTDLISQTEREAQFHLAAPELPVAPTWTLDLAALREEIPPPPKIDLDNLLANVETPVNWRVGDVDGEAPDDLVIQQGGKISVYLGGSTGPDLERPDQVLKASGNVLYFLLRDADGDGRDDLQILRAETISLGEAIRLLMIPGSLDFDIFTYGNEGGAFSRKPSTRTTVALRIPALLGFLEDVEDMRDDYDAKMAVPAQPADLDGDGVAGDVVDVTKDGLAIWRGAVPEDFRGSLVDRFSDFDADELLEAYAVRHLDTLDDGGTISIELEDIEKLLVTPGWDLRQAVGKRAPDSVYKLAFPTDDEITIRIDDANADGKDDVIVIGKRDKHVYVQLLVTP
ncbi:MAG: FG-GAP repeat domain-containing protein [Planctomycetota bacterium]|jgi:hypothetical protein